MVSRSEAPPDWAQLTGKNAATSWRAYEADPLAEIKRLHARFPRGVEVNHDDHQMLFLFQPGNVADVLLRGADVLSGRDFNLQFQGLSWDSLLSMTGRHHRAQRRMLMPAFGRASLDGYERIIRDLVSATMAEWPDESVRDLAADMHSLTVRIILKALFGTDLPPQGAERLSANFDKIFAYASYQRRAGSGQISAEAEAKLRSDYTESLAEMRAFAYNLLFNSDGQTSVTTLAGMLRQRAADGTMTRDLARDHAIGFLSAGHKTSAHSLTWTAHLLSRHPSVLAELVTELKSARAQSYAELRRVPMLMNVLRESLRLYPPAWAEGRRATTDFATSNGKIEAGKFVMLCQWATHRDPALWGPDSEDFCPKRFDAEAGERAAHSASDQYRYFPFGAGPHKCMGEQFAWLEMTIILAHLCGGFELLRVDGSRIAQDRFIPPRLTTGLPMRLVRRPMAAG
jgi:cytochrome P450